MSFVISVFALLFANFVGVFVMYLLSCFVELLIYISRICGVYVLFNLFSLFIAAALFLGFIFSRQMGSFLSLIFI